MTASETSADPNAVSDARVPAASARGRGDLVVVIPAFIEEGGVGLTIDRLRDALAHTSRATSVVIVDDGSTDATGDEARRHGAEVITLPENRGYGAALKVGIAASSEEFVAIIDADCTFSAVGTPQTGRSGRVGRHGCRSQGDRRSQHPDRASSRVYYRASACSPTTAEPSSWRRWACMRWL